MILDLALNRFQYTFWLIIRVLESKPSQVDRTNFNLQNAFKSGKWSSRALARISELGVQKYTFGGELGVQFLFIPLHYTQKIWILGCPKSVIGCPNDIRTPLWLKAWGQVTDHLNDCTQQGGMQIHVPIFHHRMKLRALFLFSWLNKTTARGMLMMLTR